MALSDWNVIPSLVIVIGPYIFHARLLGMGQAIKLTSFNSLYKKTYKIQYFLLKWLWELAYFVGNLLYHIHSRLQETEALSNVLKVLWLVKACRR